MSDDDIAREQRDIDRRAGLASMAHDLYSALQHLQRAHAVNNQLVLGVELPSESAISKALDSCAAMSKAVTSSDLRGNT